MITDTAPCRVCQGQMQGKWCSTCEEWTGVDPATDEQIAMMRALPGRITSTELQVLALIARVKQEQTHADFAAGERDDVLRVSASLRIRLDCHEEQHEHAIVARDDLLRRALPWLEDEAGALASCVEAMAHESPQSSRGERELAEMSDLITDIKARVTGRASNDARNQGESADAPEATLDAGPADEIHEAAEAENYSDLLDQMEDAWGRNADHVSMCEVRAFLESRAVHKPTATLRARLSAAEKLIGQADGIIERMVSRGTDAETLIEQLSTKLENQAERGIAVALRLATAAKLIGKMRDALTVCERSLDGLGARDSYGVVRIMGWPTSEDMQAFWEDAEEAYVAALAAYDDWKKVRDDE